MLDVVIGIRSNVEHQQGASVQRVDPADLRRRNLSYREPALYDQLLADNDTAARIASTVDQIGVEVQTVVDFGCGTGRDLAELHSARNWLGTGVDAQPELLAYASALHPRIDFVTADVTSVRLGATFDLIMCVGNTLSYLHTDNQLAAACETFAAHAHSATIVVVGTMFGAGQSGAMTTQVTTGLGSAVVETTSSWDAVTQLQTTDRNWRFDGGREENDHLIRRVHSRQDVVQHLGEAGFESLPANASDDYMLWVAWRS